MGEEARQPRLDENIYRSYWSFLPASAFPLPTWEEGVSGLELRNQGEPQWRAVISPSRGGVETSFTSSAGGGSQTKQEQAGSNFSALLLAHCDSF